MGGMVDDRCVMGRVSVRIGVDSGADVGAASVRSADLVAKAAAAEAAMAVSTAAEAGTYGDAGEGGLGCERENCGDYDG